MVSESLENLRINTLSYSELVLICPSESVTCLNDLLKLLCAYVTYRTLLWSLWTFVDVTTYHASELLIHNFISLIVNSVMVYLIYIC
jgi:hypothetical protein